MLSVYILFFLALVLFYLVLQNTNREIQLYNDFIDNTDQKNHSYQTMLADTEAKLNYTQNPEDNIAHHMRLWKLYYDGLPDRYDFDGNRLKGVAPDPNLAVYHINQAIDSGYEAGYITLARMHHYGFHDFSPNPELAKELYIYIMDHHLPNAPEAEQRYQELLEEDRYRNTSNWLNISFDKVKSMVLGTNQYAITQPPEIKPVQPKKATTSGDFLDVQLQTKDQQPIVNVFKNDSQNVHDSVLIRSIKQSIKNLQATTNSTMNEDSVIRDIRAYIKTQPTCDKKQDALRVLDAMERNTEPLIAFEMKEMDLLTLVWNRIVNNLKNQDLVKHNVYEQLADAVEHDKVVCTTGRFTRVLDALNVIDDQVSIKSRSLINRELMDKSALIRKRLYETESPENQNMIDSIQDNHIQSVFYENLRATIKNQCQKDYVETGLLTQDDLDTEINGWIDYI